MSAEESKPMTLGAIERQLLEAELTNVSRQIRSGLNQVTEAVKALGNFNHAHREPMYALIARNMEYGVSYQDIERALPEHTKVELVKRLSAKFLEKVAEIENIAHEAASRSTEAR